jgi:hypothetical protein
MNRTQPQLLTDGQMKAFIRDGVLLLKTDFPKAFHDRLLEQLNKVYQEEGNPGNNILPRIRELQKVFDHPVITGALTSVLGPDYLMHTHRHGHYNAAPTPGEWHKDSYWGYGRVRSHHSWWAMVMYFPQDTPIKLGPTGVMPGTQYYDTRTFAQDNPEGEVTANGEAGTFALIHYDIWHRSTANLLGTPRYMLKFEFMRTQAPEAPSWNNVVKGWSPIENSDSNIVSQPVLWEEHWNWLSGRIGSLTDSKPDDTDTIKRLSLQFEEKGEPAALNAAYELSSRGAGGTAALLQLLHHDNVRVSRMAAYGLSVSGQRAIAGLIQALDDERDETVNNAVFALGELRGLAAAAVPKIVHLLSTRGERIRSSVAEALGTIAEPVNETVNGLIQCLRDTDEQVRFTAALSLLRMGPAAKAAVSELEKALDDDNRYVRGHAAEALRAIDTEEAREILMKELFNLRWCSTTTKASTF